MTDPTRFLEDPNAPNEAVELIRSLSAPAPFSATSSAAIVARVEQTVANAPLASAAAKVTPAKLGTVAGAVVVGAGSLALLFSLAKTPDSGPSPVPREAPAAAQPAAPPPPAPIPMNAAEPSPEPKLAERAPRASSARDSLAVEEALLEEARKAAAASPARALSLLREHERRFPQGMLSAERLFLSAKAHAESGNKAAARRYAAELVRRFPSSSYIPRLQSIVGESPTK